MSSAEYTHTHKHTTERKLDMSIVQKEIKGIQYWVEENTNNRWEVRRWATQEDAVQAASTLVNCTDCADCTNCIACYNCTDCTECFECSACDDCISCIRCTDCTRVMDCINCHVCAKCKGCLNLNETAFKICVADSYPADQCRDCIKRDTCKEDKRFFAKVGFDCPYKKFDATQQ